MIQIDHARYGDLNAAEKLNVDIMRNGLVDFLRSSAGIPIKNAKNADLIRELKRDNFDLERYAREACPHHRSVNSSDFAELMTSALTIIVRDQWAELSTKINPYARMIEVDNFNPIKFAQIQFPDPVETSEDSPVHFAMPTIASTTVGSLRTFETAIRISQQLWQTHGQALVDASVDYSYQMFRLELKLLSELLVANPTLSDGDTLFNTENQTGSNFGLTGLDSAINHFSTDLTHGPLTPGALMLHPIAAATAATIIHQAGFNWPILLSPWLPTGSWFLFANQQGSASILRLRERGSSMAPTVGWQRIPQTSAMGYYAAVDLGFRAISRHGLFRGGMFNE